ERIIFGEGRKIERIVPVQRNEAHKLIEECMLCANVAAANFLKQHQLPGLYRIHETPSAEKLAKLREFIGELGLSLSGADKPSAKDYQQLILQIADRPDAHLIQTVLLRSMMQAVYSPDNVGHFGLAYESYAHFTSPIRRYPDLLVHRAIRSVIRSKKTTSHVRRVAGAKGIQRVRIYPYQHEDMLQLGEHCSHTERRADEAVRDVVLWLKCEYMLDHVGDTFTGVISGVTAFGLFIELKDIYVEGLLHVSALDNDYYHFDAAKHRLTGERTHFSYRLGDSIEIRVARVDLDERKIDFELLPQEKKTSGKSKKGGKRSAKGKGFKRKRKDN
ncbi:MAG: RNB domain-containing ribonuclease, partial [Pseudomonadales bacterium]|nr:RNB domain-containing ribonuclease [Pseudomonadales bacterium]